MYVDELLIFCSGSAGLQQWLRRRHCSGPADGFGPIMSDDLSDDNNMCGQQGKLFAQANIMCQKCSFSSVLVNILLFGVYCTYLGTVENYASLGVMK